SCSPILHAPAISPSISIIAFAQRDQLVIVRFIRAIKRRSEALRTGIRSPLETAGYYQTSRCAGTGGASSRLLPVFKVAYSAQARADVPHEHGAGIGRVSKRGTQALSLSLQLSDLSEQNMGSPTG